MRFEWRTKIGAALVVLCLQIGLAQTQSTFAQETAPQAKSKTDQRGGFMQMRVDPRVQMRSYRFQDTDEDIQYAVFVSSKVTKDRKSPLIITLHGLGIGPAIMFTGDALDLAEKGGYILVGPMGYNVRGWYGISMKGFGRKGAPTKAADSPGAAPKPKASMFFNPDDPPNLNELSEKDVMNVLDIILKEFNVDDRRIYLMGHSMGGAGTLYLGTKYPSIWAALAAIAPAAFTLDPDILKGIQDMPVMIVQGGNDNLVPADNTRRWVDKLKELNMTYEYNEIPGADHGSAISDGLPGIYEFFDKHSKPVSH